jgi:hypothetical protein
LALKDTLPQTPHSAGSLRHWVRPFTAIVISWIQDETEWKFL